MKIRVVCSRAVLALFSLAAGVCVADETHPKRASDAGAEFGINVRSEATASDAGLPTYPGSKPYKEGDSDSSSGNVGISTALFGLKVVAIQLETRDQPEKVAAFYRRALSKYGPVLDCSNASKNKAGTVAASSDELKCEPDDPGTHDIMYKVGTAKNQRIVALKPHGSGTRFDLVRLNIRGRAE